MILVKTPLRVTFGGGGTDIFDYSDFYEGYCIGATLNKYCYITLNENYYDNFTILKYAITEKVLNKKEIKHPIFNKVLNSIKYKHGVEISTFMDVPSSSGLGSSSSFSVGLFNVITSINKIKVSKRKLAEKSVYLERFLLREKGGIQDQYLCSYGGLNEITINKNRNVKIKKINISNKNINRLENCLSLFYLGLRRSSNKIQSNTFSKKLSKKKITTLSKIKDLAVMSKIAIQNGNMQEFGECLNENWTLKKSLNKEIISSSRLNEIYKIALKSGAVGGKIVGAGGGGFYLFCSLNYNHKKNLISKLNKMGLKNLEFKFEFEGTQKFVL